MEFYYSHSIFDSNCSGFEYDNNFNRNVCKNCQKRKEMHAIDIRNKNRNSEGLSPIEHQQHNDKKCMKNRIQFKNEEYFRLFCLIRNCRVVFETFDMNLINSKHHIIVSKANNTKCVNSYQDVMLCIESIMNNTSNAQCSNTASQSLQLLHQTLKRFSSSMKEMAASIYKCKVHTNQFNSSGNNNSNPIQNDACSKTPIFDSNTVPGLEMLKIIQNLDEIYYHLYYSMEMLGINTSHVSNHKQQRKDNNVNHWISLKIPRPDVYFCEFGYIYNALCESNHPVNNVLSNYLKEHCYDDGYLEIKRMYGDVYDFDSNQMKQRNNRNVGISDRASCGHMNTSVKKKSDGNKKRKYEHAIDNASKKVLSVADENPLLYLHFIKWVENCLLLPLLNPDYYALPRRNISMNCVSVECFNVDTSKLLKECVVQPSIKSSEMKSTSKDTKSVHSVGGTTMKNRDPLLPTWLRQWNDHNRIWNCRIFAFATPTNEAMMCLDRHTPLIEMGAGTGYWAMLLQKWRQKSNSCNEGVSVDSSQALHQQVGDGITPYDISPTTTHSNTDMSSHLSMKINKNATHMKLKLNDYHGCSKAWTTVHKGSIEQISVFDPVGNVATSSEHLIKRDHMTNSMQTHQHKRNKVDKVTKSVNLTRNLFLCYPPPDSEMALQCLKHFVNADQDSTICYVGEWQGDTGTSKFEKLLSSEYVCAEIIPLPNWVDTCYSLMVWKRRKYFSWGMHSTGDIHATNSGNSGNKRGSHDGADIPNAAVDHLQFPFYCCVCRNNHRKDLTNAHYTNVNLHRCRITYDVCFCSDECASTAIGRKKHYNALFVRHLLCKQEPHINLNDGAVSIDSCLSHSPLINIGMSFYRRVNAPPLIQFSKQ